MTIWAISDLHLSSVQPKPMDVFGPHWKNHPQRLATAWRARVAADDWVLIAGDISWAMKVADALPDLAWIDALPGRKVLIRGNHDYWYPRRVGPLRAQLPPSMTALGGDAADIGAAVVCGTRGWLTPEMPGYEPETDAKIYHRELLLLDTALQRAHQLARGQRPIIVMIHYPPFINGQPTEFARRMGAAGAAACIYGHLHRREDWATATQGTVEGVFYQLTACDYLDFMPVLVRGLHR
ncbi:MAG: metallophosphoesterase [Chloroflexaceae bacterium]|nr:metallophosphoesterase [Chloroflexaceae bacterium]